ncbi:MAG TPA: ABC transporter substrate-binding protein [Acidimicrobiales bacterium]|nr:ABC transporter substrate-binding protein [Acidimicrobiales bacterium]
MASTGNLPVRSVWRRRGFHTAAAAAAIATSVALAGCGSSSNNNNSSTNTTASGGLGGGGGSGTTTSTTLGKTGGGTAKGTATSGSIKFWASPITTSSPDPRKVLITAFEKAYPHIKVTLESAPSDTDTNRSVLSSQIGGGGGPDVYMGDVIWPAQFGSQKFAVPLSKYLPNSYFNTFAPGLIAGATYNGQVYGAPFFEDQGFLYYRKDILKADHLQVPKTWEQLVSESKQIQAKKQTKYGYVFQAADYEGATCNFMEFLTDAGGKVLNSSANKSELSANNAAVKALTFMHSLVSSGVSPSGESTYQEANAMNAFDAGDAAFLRNWDYAYSTSQASGSKVIGKVGVAPLPTFKGQSYPGYSNIGGWNLYVNPNSKNVAADITFVKWMTGTKAQNILATQFSEIPTNQSVRTESKVVKSNAVLAIVPKTRLVARPAQTPKYAAVSQAIYQNVSAAVGGSKSPSAAISAANSSINSTLSGGGL